jgi:hypothetical protein
MLCASVNTALIRHGVVYDTAAVRCGRTQFRTTLRALHHLPRPASRQQPARDGPEHRQARMQQPVTEQLPAKPSRQALQAKTASKPLRVTGKLRVACDMMVWGVDGDGLALSWDEAARQADYRVRSMRLALERPHVVKYLNQQKEVFRSSASAKNISRAVQLRDQDDNRTAAQRALEWLDRTAAERSHDGIGGSVMPGVVILIERERDARMVIDGTVIELNPLEQQDKEGSSDE